MTETHSDVAPPTAQRWSADWGGKALLVFALALLMAIPAILVFALIMERTSRAQSAIAEVSALHGGSQQILGPVLVAPYLGPRAKDGSRAPGLYVVSAERGQAAALVKSSTLHRGIFQVPVYETTVDVSAVFAPPPQTPSLPVGSTIDWSDARVVVGFSDLRGAQTDVDGKVTSGSTTANLIFTPASALSLGDPSAGAAQNGSSEAVTPAPPASASQASGNNASSFGLVAASAGPLPASGGSVHVVLRLTGAERMSILPFAKSTLATISGDWPAPSFDGGFLPQARTLDSRGFRASWAVPFIARGMSGDGDVGAMSLQSLSGKDLGVSFVRANNPYQNVMRALKYAVMFVGLVFLTFFVFEALSVKRVHAAQYVLIGLAQMVFYLLLLSLSEYVGFDLAFAAAAAATVALISLYAGWAFRSAAYRWRALVIFSVVYGLIYLLLRLEDFALLVGSIASFVGLAGAMYLTRNINWYGGRALAAAAAEGKRAT